MKQIWFLLLLLPASVWAQKNDYHISLDIKDAKGHTFYLMPVYGGLQNRENALPIDSVAPLNDTFSFHGQFSDMKYYSLVSDTNRSFYPIVLDTGITKITGHADSAVRYAHSPQNDMLQDFETKTKSLYYAIGNSIRGSKAGDSLQHLFKDTLIYFTGIYPNSFGIFGTAQYFINSDKEFAKKIFPLFSAQIRNSAVGKQIGYSLQFNPDSIIGKPFPVIKVSDVNKHWHELKLDPQHIYLIDYWASWCMPCIQALPALKKIHTANSKKKFKIISLSVDKSYDAWVNAVKKHEIPWDNYSALNGTETDDVKYFNIESIPYMVLVGKGNKIVKLNPTEEEIEAYLKESELIRAK
ncbi:DUF4369 domain-containing protein [Taibaiella lutea]|uniref:DUF4369 domain-containing protein n=1 Tax=Taibaiella lutea TaxID=2608001 RepID=A0A5M6CAT3_9BACT|nr:thioredoxin-like domain-containing protein [Taibaiella lutea]KAA5532103.1 DUF4369 domain-containing protein [Taibaiella lutea]